MSFVESKMHYGGEGTGDEIDVIGRSMGRCKSAVKEKAREIDPNKLRGIVVKFLEERGIGWIAQKDNPEDVFFHISQCKVSSVPKGAKVAFNLSIDSRSGKESARNIELI